MTAIIPIADEDDIVKSEFTEIIVNEPRYLFAAIDGDGNLFVYRSVIVSEAGELYEPVRQWIAEHNAEQISEGEHAAPLFKFRRAKERIYRAAAILGGFVAIGAFGWVFLAGTPRVEHTTDVVPAPPSTLMVPTTTTDTVTLPPAPPVTNEVPPSKGGTSRTTVTKTQAVQGPGATVTETVTLPAGPAGEKPPAVPSKTATSTTATSSEEAGQ